ncbi:hypothetical protein M885DRAFT_523302 [Pelagophyceae sp. CCMP2097]|nr:hypothetical protein M885DRAFT_523302 [Pelagophyceae sp. CCMP2097]
MQYDTSWQKGIPTPPPRCRVYTGAPSVCTRTRLLGTEPTTPNEVCVPWQGSIPAPMCSSKYTGARAPRDPIP